MKKVLFIIIIFILLVIINNLAHSMYDIWQKRDYVKAAQKELDLQKQQNQRLKSQLSYSQTQEFVEKEARDKLFMVKKGEQRVLVPSDSEIKKESKKENIPNWREWWNLFF